MPALQPYLIEPIWQQFQALLPQRETNHPLGCHRPRVPDRLVFAKLVEVLVFGCAYWRIADESCSESTLRRRRDEWIDLGVMERLREISLEAYYDRLIGLELSDVAVDGCITKKAPCGGQKAGRSPVDRGKGGVKRSTVVDAGGIPLGTIVAPANRHDSPLLAETLDAPWPRRSGDSAQEDERPRRPRLRLEGDPRKAARAGVARRDLREGQARPFGGHEEVGRGARTNSWHNAHKKLVWCTERVGGG